MSFAEDVGGILGGAGGAAIAGPAGVGAGASAGGFLGGLFGGSGTPGKEFWRQMEGNGWANEQWAKDYAAWLQKYRPSTWATGDIWDNWPQPTPYLQAWRTAADGQLDADLKPITPKPAGVGDILNKPAMGTSTAGFQFPWQRGAVEQAGWMTWLLWIGGAWLVWKSLKPMIMTKRKKKAASYG